MLVPRAIFWEGRYDSIRGYIFCHILNIFFCQLWAFVQESFLSFNGLVLFFYFFQVFD